MKTLLRSSVLMVLLISFLPVSNVLAWSIGSVTFEWVPNPPGYTFEDAILARRCINANYHWLTSEELSPNPRRLGSWKYGSINSCVSHYPVYGVAVGDVIKIGVGASDSDPGAESELYTHPNTRFWRCERTSSGLDCIEITNPSPPSLPSGSSNPSWYLRNSNSGGDGDVAFVYGRDGDIPLIGDWNGDGIDTPGVFRSSTRTWYLRNSNSGGAGNPGFVYGLSGDIPVVGDWNGDGTDTIGVFRNDTRTWYLRNSNSGGTGDMVFDYGRPGDTPIVGDWNGDGIDTVGVFDSETRTWYLRNSNSGGVADIEFQYGQVNDIPVVGDWDEHDGDDIDTVGVFRATDEKWYLRNSNSGGTADIEFSYGNSNDIPITGDWNGNNEDTVGVVRTDVVNTLISNLQVSSGQPYEVGNCSVGSRYYVDRDYTITEFSNSDYDGLTCIKTSNEDDDDTSGNLIEFDLNSPARIYIYWDSRAGEAGRPGWMEGLYPINGKKIYTTDSDMDYFNVLSCDSTPGHITLGGPHSGGGTGSKSMYVLAFKPIETGETLCSAIDAGMPTGNITSPQDQQEFGPNDQISFAATASDNPGGSGIKQVQFWVHYATKNHDNYGWHFAGADFSPPYSVNWARPSDMHSQVIKVGIHVEDNAGNYCIDPDSSGNYTCLDSQSQRIFVYLESKGDDTVEENWIPKNLRFYLNQRSLSNPIACDPDGEECPCKDKAAGDCKCSGASAAMLLAMLGKISGDYETMAAKAEEIYKTLPDPRGSSLVAELNKELESLNLEIREKVYGKYWPLMSEEQGWKTIKTAIGNEDPIILLSTNFITAGHYMVIVGYREQGSTREIIAYDPYGRWKGKIGTKNYDANGFEADSFKGQWVYYDIDDFWPGSESESDPKRNKVFLYVIKSTQQMNTISSLNQVTATVPSTPPDLISTEPQTLVTFEGVPIYSSIYLPLVIRQ